MRRVAVVFLVSVAACQTIAGSSSEVYVNEFAVRPDLERFQAGNVTLEVQNEGEYGHTLVITDSHGQVISAADVIRPGETSMLSVDLAAGEYSLTCRIVAQDDEGNLIDHYEQGMMANVVVIAG